MLASVFIKVTMFGNNKPSVFPLEMSFPPLGLHQGHTENWVGSPFSHVFFLKVVGQSKVWGVAKCCGDHVEELTGWTVFVNLLETSQYSPFCMLLHD